MMNGESVKGTVGEKKGESARYYKKVRVYYVAEAWVFKDRREMSVGSHGSKKNRDYMVFSGDVLSSK